MPIDFKALMNKTPEEREADRLRREQEYAEQDRKERETLALRIEQVERLAEIAEAGKLTPWETQFMTTLSSRARGFDIVTSMAGGTLLRLSVKELPIFERLVTQHIKPAAGEAAAEADASTSLPPPSDRG